MILCEYDCGQEAKHQLKNGKWCCSKSQNSCLEIRKKFAEARKGKPSKLKGRTYKEIHGEEKAKKIIKGKKGKNHPMYGKKHPGRLTIEKVKKKYKLFSQIEEMRYNPNKPKEKEIQVHCKYNECENSKEKNGWFTPTSNQIYHRGNTLKTPKGFGESNFYCSQKCKDLCPCYNLKTDLLQLTKFQNYYKEVQKFTNLSLKYNSNKILNIELRGRKYGYDLDHKFSIIDGFNNDIEPKIIGHWKNLEVIKTSDNIVKSGNSSISIKEIQKIEKLKEN